MSPSVHQSPVDRQVGAYEALTIGMYASDLSVGDRKSGLLCPFCHGGGTKEKSFSVICYFDNVSWKCWRGSCNKSGRLNAKTGEMREASAPLANPYDESRPHLYNMTAISGEWNETLIKKYSITPELAMSKGWLGNSLGHLVIPIRKPGMPVIIGHEFKKLNGFPKTLMNFTTNGEFPRNAFETPKDRKTVLIVEDSISALKASQVCRTYALLGINFIQKHVEELIEQWPADNYLLALDKDATLRGEAIIKRYKFLMPNLKLCPIQKDLKYHYVADIEQLVRSYS